MSEIDAFDILLVTAALVYSWRLCSSGQPPPVGNPTGDAMPAASSPASGGGPGASLADRLQAILRACGFDRIEEFTDGARRAHEAIVTGFSRGELDGLPLADDVRRAFEAAIAARRARGEEVTLTLVALQAADIADCGIEGCSAWISVRFSDLLASVTRDRDGAVVAGHPTAVGEVVETWTFEKDLRVRDPNWLLSATEVNAGERHEPLAA